MTVSRQPAAKTAYSRNQGRRAVRFGGIELLLNPRVLLLSLLVLGVLALLIVWAMTLGSYPLPFGVVAGAVVAQGDPAAMVTETMPREVFRVEATVGVDPLTWPHRALPDGELDQETMLELILAEKAEVNLVGAGAGSAIRTVA